LGVENVLRRKLLELRRRAEDNERPPSNKKMIRYLKAVPLALRNMARLVEQWDKFYLAAAEIGETPDGTVLSALLDVQPGQVVRLDAIHDMAPLLTVEGRARVNLWLETGDDGAERVRVQLVSERLGRAAVRFDSWVYGFVRLLAFPIEDWALREMTITTTRPARHRKETTVELLLAACRYTKGEDPRRAIRIHTTRQLDVVTRGDNVDRNIVRDLQFEYFRPDRVWSYEREWTDALPKP
jgi:hypothetical protein